MINTILFDLDGTLLPMDAELFEKIYIGNAAKKAKDIIKPEDMGKLLWSSTNAMISNTEFITNETAFMTDFEAKVGEGFPKLMELFDEYYENEFDLSKEATSQNAFIQDAIKLLKKKGYKLVIATNPMFPALAIKKRIEWAGVNIKDFDYVTSFENNHYCKPQTAFYVEVLSDIKKTPAQCMMVGNDEEEDMIASQIGITTYLITENKISRGDKAINPDYAGTYEDFLNFARDLPYCK